MNNSWIDRKKTNPIFVGSVGVGGDHPISIQSMTNTNTADIQATVSQIEELEAAGADIVRVSVPDKDCANAFKSIKDLVSVPLVADIHFDYKIALLVADSADCLRINPGNIGKENKVQEIIQAAKDNDIPIRIGVNDSLDHAKDLVNILNGLSCKINLIPFNPFDGCNYLRSQESAIYQFKDFLIKKGLITTLRITRGDAIDGACGQLVGKLTKSVKGKNKKNSINLINTS